LLALGLSAACESELEVKTSRVPAQNEENPNICSDPGINRNSPKIVNPGEEFVIEGSIFKEGTQVAIDGREVSAFETSNGEIGIMIPAELATKKIDISIVQGNSITKVDNVYALNEDDFPLITAAPSTICNNQKFYNADGELVKGTKECDIYDPNLLPENIKSGVTIAGVEGTSVAESYNECEEDGGIECVATTNFPAAKAQGLAEKVASGSKVAGIAGSFITATVPLCTSDGETGCQTSIVYRAALTTNAATKIRSGQILAGIAGTHSPDFPNTANVLSNDTVDGSPGTYMPPSSADVEAGVTFGPGLSLTGTLIVPPVTNVSDGIQFGHAGEFIGTASIEAHAECTVDGSQGCVANNTFYAATSCASNGDNDCFAAASSAYDAADLTNLTAANVKAGVNIAGTTGNLASPATGDVQSGVTYGSGGNEFTGTFTEPGVANVEAGVQYGALGNEFTGVFAVPPAANVANGVNYGNAAEFTGSADIESHVDCTVDGSQGCVANNTFYAATSCASNGDNDCFAAASSPYDAADLTNLAAANIKAGITIAGTSGDLASPAAGDVQSGVTYGSGGNEFTGTFTEPGVANVEAGVQYGALGNEFTGVLSLPAATDVEAGVQYGGNGSEITGTFEVPSSSDVASGVSYGSSAEFSGSATIESHMDCTVDGAVGCVTTVSYKAADTAAFSSSDLRSGKTVASISGSLTLPSESDVANGVTFGGGGTSSPVQQQLKLIPTARGPIR